MTNKVKQRIEQIGRGEVPEGYRKTKAGIMPDAWLSDKIYKAKDVFYSVTNKKHNGQFEVLSATQDRGVIPRSQVDIDIKYSEESISGYKKVDKGDFVISLRSFQGGIEYSEYEGLVSPAYTVLKNKLPICDGYYKAYFKTNDYINRLNKGTYGIRDGKQVGFEDFGDMVIHYPSLVEQERIAEILGTQDKLIALKEKRIAEKKQQKKYLMQQLLTGKKRLPGFTGEWKSVKIGNSFKVISGYPFDSKNFTDSGVSVIRIQNIDNGVVNLTNSAKHNKFDICQYNVAYTGDVLIAMSGATTGKIGVYLGEEEAYINQRVGKFIVLGSNVVKKQYLIQILLSELFFDKLKVLLSTGAQPNIGSGDLEKMKFMVPMEVKEQQAIANILSQADQEIEVLQKDLEEEKNKKKALMQLLLTGIVRVTE